MRSVVRLLRWYDAHGRRLPWRRTRDPYRVLVSEVMLQQTQVARVIDFYHSWLQRFPDWQTLARATNGAALEAWSGLGYNRRALMLRDIARHVVAHGVPRTQDAWRSVRGVGAYTAAAIAAFAFRQAVLPVDTNIRRVGGRLWLKRAFARPADDARLRRAGARWIGEHARAHDVPQALFDLATSHCTKVPDCAHCPLRRDCPMTEAFLDGSIRIPKRSTPKAHETVREGKQFPDRIYRGRILKYVRDHGASTVASIGRAVDLQYTSDDRKWLEAMIARLDRDGMVKRRGTRVIAVK